MNFHECEQAFPGFREWARGRFIDNECDTDEYGETQPAKGFNYVADVFNRVNDPKDGDLLAEVLAWVNAIQTGGRYDGADELVPICGRAFDLLWADGEHPYYNVDEAEELLADYREEMEYFAARAKREAGDE